MFSVKQKESLMTTGVQNRRSRSTSPLFSGWTQLDLPNVTFNILIQNNSNVDVAVYFGELSDATEEDSFNLLAGQSNLDILGGNRAKVWILALPTDTITTDPQIMGDVVYC